LTVRKKQRCQQSAAFNQGIIIESWNGLGWKGPDRPSSSNPPKMGRANHDCSFKKRVGDWNYSLSGLQMAPLTLCKFNHEVQFSLKGFRLPKHGNHSFLLRENLQHHGSQ